MYNFLAELLLINLFVRNFGIIGPLLLVAAFMGLVKIAELIAAAHSPYWWLPMTSFISIEAFLAFREYWYHENYILRQEGWMEKHKTWTWRTDEGFEYRATARAIYVYITLAVIYGEPWMIWPFQ